MDTIMQKILKRELNSDSKNTSLFLDALEPYMVEILKDLKGVKTGYLYDSFIHGRNHIERVYIFSFLLGKISGLNETDMRIVLDASLYHDIGRTTDTEDTIHGLGSKNILDAHKILENDIYKDDVNRSLLYAIVEGHSLDDSYRDINYENNFYELGVDAESYDRYCRLYDILKDADALDRTRFGRKSFSTVDEEFLRIDASKTLVEFAYEINGIFKQEMIKGYKEHKVDPTKGGLCFHSIGFDFTKVNPILEKGVLSLSERVKMNLNVPSNFEGGNSDRWISVVDIDAIRMNAGAFSTFTKNGIGFICQAEEMIKGYSNKDRGKALEHGYPYDKSEYQDERYVYRKIDVDNILGVVIPESYKEKSLTDIIYVHNAMTVETYEYGIKKYEQMLAEKGLRLDRKRINELLLEYKEVLRRFKRSKGKEREELRDSLAKDLSAITKEVSKVIGVGLDTYYKLVTGKDTVTVTDALHYEISRSNIPYDILEPGLYSINARERVDLQNLIGRLK